jgi:hypothetical protein
VTTEEQRIAPKQLITTAYYASGDAPAKLEYSFFGAGEPLMVSASDTKVEVAPGSSPAVERMMAISGLGGVFLYLTRNGRPICAMVPVEVADAARTWPGDLDDSPLEPEPVTDTTTLHGSDLPDFDTWQAALNVDRQP